MVFLTVFSAPKPFTNPHINIIQRNAIQSWMHLKDVEVILIGDEAGIRETAGELGVRNVPEVARDEKGIPQVDAVMRIGHKNSDSPMLCYANADMILLPDLVEAARQVSQQAKDFLVVGQRRDLEKNGTQELSGEREKRKRRERA